VVSQLAQLALPGRGGCQRSRQYKKMPAHKAVVLPGAVVPVVAVERMVAAVPVLAAVSVKAAVQMGTGGTKGQRCRQWQSVQSRWE
jgi:hypothetical protein